MQAELTCPFCGTKLTWATWPTNLYTLGCDADGCVGWEAGPFETKEQCIAQATRRADTRPQAAGEVCQFCGATGPHADNYHSFPKPAPAEPKGEVGSVEEALKFVVQEAKLAVSKAFRKDNEITHNRLQECGRVAQAALSSLQQPESARVREAVEVDTPTVWTLVRAIEGTPSFAEQVTAEGVRELASLCALLEPYRDAAEEFYGLILNSAAEHPETCRCRICGVAVETEEKGGLDAALAHSSSGDGANA